MKREQILTECTKAVAACWNHYSDVPLIAVDVAAIREKLHFMLPSHVTTAQWQQYADEYKKHEDECQNCSDPCSFAEEMMEISS